MNCGAIRGRLCMRRLSTTPTKYAEVRKKEGVYNRPVVTDEYGIARRPLPPLVDYTRRKPSIKKSSTSFKAPDNKILPSADVSQANTVKNPLKDTSESPFTSKLKTDRTISTSQATSESVLADTYTNRNEIFEIPRTDPPKDFAIETTKREKTDPASILSSQSADIGVEILSKKSLADRKTESPLFEESYMLDATAINSAPEPEAISLLNRQDRPTNSLYDSVRKDMDRFPDALVLTQVGKFYESYFEQAREVANQLHIRLASKQFRVKRYAFCGFPTNALQKHLQILIEHGHKVVIVNEFTKPETNDLGDPTGKSIITRRVAQIVTPGTAIDEGMIKDEEAKFILALGLHSDDREVIGLAYRDVSTGAYFTRQTDVKELRDALLLIRPAEVVIGNLDDSGNFGRSVQEILEGESQREGWVISKLQQNLEARDTTEPKSAKYAAETVLKQYLSNTLMAAPESDSTAIDMDEAKVVHLDSTTIVSLEIKESLRGGVKGSFLSTVKRTVTHGGTRLLAQRLCAPSTELSVINERLSFVSTFYVLTTLRSYLRGLLKQMDDSSRLIQRLYLGKGFGHELLKLKDIILATKEIRTNLNIESKWFEDQVALRDLFDNLGDHTPLARKIEESIDQVGLNQKMEEDRIFAERSQTIGETTAQREQDDANEEEGLWGKSEVWVFKPDCDSSLVKLHLGLKQERQAAFNLEKTLRDKYSIATLKLKLVPRIGAAVHVERKYKPGVESMKMATDVFTQSSQTKTTNIFLMKSWTQLSGKINRYVERIRRLEDLKLQELLKEVSIHHDSLRLMAETLEKLDVSLGFAELAHDMNLVKPTVHDGTSLTIVGGRHLTVDKVLQAQGRQFVSNDVNFINSQASILCLTGPNMAGKSTYLRQNALICILAQVGSFVPAKSADIGIVDRIYSRVGARDELDRDRSTFMVEMDETASILHSATEKSLVLMDELGRGTSPLDGLSIAYGALEHLLHVNQSRTLFATHFHRLGDLLGYDDEKPFGKGKWQGVEFWCTDVEEQEDSVTYTHTLRRGLNDDSGGLIIARMAGMPSSVIHTARVLRDQYRQVSN